MLDTVHAAALDRPTIWPVWVAWLDILNDPLRLTSSPYPLTFTGTGDPDLDGQVFGAVNEHQPISISDVQHREGGAGTVTVALSGLLAVDMDAELLNVIGDVSNWRGRVARLWRVMLSENLTMIGRPAAFYTGYMSVPRIVGDGATQTIQMSIESYLASLTQASGRSYLSQSQYDPGDLSADAAIAIANGTNSDILAGGGGGALADAIAAGGLAGGAGGRIA